MPLLTRCDNSNFDQAHEIMSFDVSSQADPENTLGLVQVWSILARRRLWVTAILMGCLAAGGLYMILMAPVYESRVRIQIGQVAGAGPIEAPEVLATRLLARYGKSAADGIVRSRPFLTHASAQRGTAAVVELVAEGDRPDDPAQLLKTIFEETERFHGVTYSRSVQGLTDQLRLVDERRVAWKKQIDDASEALDSLKSRDPVQATLIMVERGQMLASLTALEEQRPKLIQILSAPQTQPTRLLGEIVPPRRPAYPRIVPVMVLATIAGLLGGALFAFALEFAAIARRATT